MKSAAFSSFSLAALLVAGAAANAAPLSNVTINGTPAQGWTSVGGSMQLVAPQASFVTDGAANNIVELGQFGSSPATTLTGTGNGHTFTFSSLTYADWTANSNALTTSYITAAAASIGATLTSGQLLAATSQFLDLTNQTTQDPWRFVSDPNVSYIDLNGNALTVALAGFLNASPLLQTMFGMPVPPGAQASEVIKVTIDDMPSQYLFSFTGATASGLVQNPALNFSGLYVLTTQVPEPGSIALVGLGLVGLVAARRRKIHKA